MRPRLVSMFAEMMPSRFGARARSSNLPVLHVVGQQVAAGIGLVARRRDAHRFRAVDDAVVADVRGEIELAVRLDEVHMALALRNRLLPLLAAGLGEVAELPDLSASWGRSRTSGRRRRTTRS